MSRIGKLPIELPKGVTVKVNEGNTVVVKGPLGEMTQKLNGDMKIAVKDNIVEIVRPGEEKSHKSLHGLTRSLLNNMVVGVSKGYIIMQELVGVGYKAANNGQILELSLGYSHDIFFELPKEVQVETKTERRANPIITLKSMDKQLIGQVAAKIRSFRPPEPYKGKGIKFVNEQLRRKSGKAAAGAAS